MVSPSTPRPSDSSATAPIPIPVPSLKRAANEVLSPDPPKHRLSPHVPRTPPSIDRSGHFLARYAKSPCGGEYSRMEVDSEAAAAPGPLTAELKPGPHANGAVTAHVQASDTVGHDIQSEQAASADKTINGPAQTRPGGHKEEQLRRTIQQHCRIKDKAIYFLVASDWHMRWSRFVADDHEPHPGPIDNAPLFQNKSYQELKPDLKEGSDYIAVPESIWHKLLTWYGLVHEKQIVSRRTYANADSVASTWLLDVYPPHLDVVYVKPSGEESEKTRFVFSSASTLADLIGQISDGFAVAPNDVELWIETKKERKLLQGLNKTYTQLNLELARRAELRHRDKFNEEVNSSTETQDALDAENAEPNEQPQTDIASHKADATDAVDLPENHAETANNMSKPELDRLADEDVPVEDLILPPLKEPDAQDEGRMDVDDKAKANDKEEGGGQENGQSSTAYLSKRERILRQLDPNRNQNNDDVEKGQPVILGYTPLSSTPASETGKDDNEKGKSSVFAPVSRFSFSGSLVSSLPVGATGLNNLGNTCFMNSALQCLSNTPPLTKYFLKGSWEKELNPENPLGMKGEVAAAYADLIMKLWQPSPQRPSSVAPRQFKSTIGRFNSMFSGYSQQDSQELLGFLVDGLHEDLNRIKKKPYIEAPDMDGQLDEDIATKAWEIYCMRNDSVVVDLFQGQYKSRVQCTVCGKLSVTFDPYMFLSVPIPDYRQITLSVIAVPKVQWNASSLQESHRRLLLTLPKDANIKTLKQRVAERMNWADSMNVLVVETHMKTIYKFFDDGDPVSSIAQNDIIHAVELGEPDWDLFEVPEHERVAENVRHCPIYATIDCANETFMEPLVVTLPARITTQISVAQAPRISEEERVRRCKVLLCDRIYRVFVRAIRKHAKIQLFGSGVNRWCIKEAYDWLEERIAKHQERCRRKRAQSLERDTKDEEECTEDDEFNDSVSELSESSEEEPFFHRDIGPECHPIVDLFDLYVLNPRYNTDSVDFYYRGWKHQRGARILDVQHAREEELARRKMRAVEEDSTDADDEASDSDTVTAPVRRPRGFSKGQYCMRIVSDREGGVSISENGEKEPPAVSEFTWGVPQGALFILDWDREVAHYVFEGGQFEPKEDEGNKAVQAEIDARRNAPKKTIALQDCLDEYRKEETLGDDNSWYCPRCKEHRPTKKKLDIWTVPEILVFHLKRFSNAGRGYRSMMSDKIDALVDAPIHDLDLTDVVMGKHPARKWKSHDSVKTETSELASGSPMQGASDDTRAPAADSPTDMEEDNALDPSKWPSAVKEAAKRSPPVESSCASDKGPTNADQQTNTMEAQGDAMQISDTESPGQSTTHTASQNATQVENEKPSSVQSQSTESLAMDADTKIDDPSNTMDEETDKDNDDSLVYDLFAVSNHFGGLGGGHYTAFAKNCLDGQWYNFDDSHVSKTDESNVMTSAAYLLFYQRRHKGNKTDLTQVLKDVQKRAEEEAASAKANATITSGYFLNRPSAPSPARPAIRLSRPSGTGLVSPITTSADTTQNNSPLVSPTGSLVGSAVNSDNEDVDEERKAKRTLNRLTHGAFGPLGTFGPSFPDTSPTRLSVGFEFGQQLGGSPEPDDDVPGTGIFHLDLNDDLPSYGPPNYDEVARDATEVGWSPKISESTWNKVDDDECESITLTPEMARVDNDDDVPVDELILPPLEDPEKDEGQMDVDEEGKGSSTEEGDGKGSMMASTGTGGEETPVLVEYESEDGEQPEPAQDLGSKVRPQS